jgi:hypothetical protein
MTPERCWQIEELYHSARDRGPAERAAFLAECRKLQKKFLKERGLRDKPTGLFLSPATRKSVSAVSVTPWGCKPDCTWMRSPWSSLCIIPNER